MQRILNYMMFIVAPAVLVISLIWGGGLMFVSSIQGNVGLGQRGRKVIFNTLIGIVLVFGSWLIIDTVIKILGGRIAVTFDGDRTGFLPWNEIVCTAPRVDLTPPPLPTPGIPDPGGPKCQNCVTLASRVIPHSASACALGAQCQVNEATADKLRALNQRIVADQKGAYWQVTEAWPPTVTHQNPCHLAATCVDANFIQSANRKNASDIIYFINQSNAVGLKAVYEVLDPDRMNQLITLGVPRANIIFEPKISGEHFSVYNPPLSGPGAK